MTDRAEWARTEQVLNDVLAERDRAHALHGDTSMESYPVDDLNRLAILMEEVGEVSKEFNEARHDGRPVALARLRKELIQRGRERCVDLQVVRLDEGWAAIQP